MRKATRIVVCLGVLLLAIYGPATARELPRIVPTCGGRPATLIGTPGRDVLRGGNRLDVIVGLGGNDVLLGHNGNDRLCGGPGDDVLRGYWNNDRLFGGPGDDFLGGGGWGDGLRGGPGNDFLKGGWLLKWICPDIAYFAPDGPPITVYPHARTIVGQGVDRYVDLNAIYGTRAEDTLDEHVMNPHFHQHPRPR